MYNFPQAYQHNAVAPHGARGLKQTYQSVAESRRVVRALLRGAWIETSKRPTTGSLLDWEKGAALSRGAWIETDRY